MSKWILAFLASGVAAVLTGVSWTQFQLPAEQIPWVLYLVLLNASGYLSVLAMSVAIGLSTRSVLADRWLGGLDRLYVLHRRLGEIGIGLGAFHYLLKLGSQALRRREVLHKPEAWEGESIAFFGPVRDIAKIFGEWGLYVAGALLVVALLRAIPYWVFLRFHRFFAVLYLGFLFHSVVFMPSGYWMSLAGLLFFVFGSIGASGAVLSLTGRIGANRRVKGRVSHVEHLSDSVLEIHMNAGPTWYGHRSGQFALFTFDTREGGHPFTIASAWNFDGHLMIAVKALGDHTSNLVKTLIPGAPVQIEGPFGQFDFSCDAPEQVWIAGGIGLTPFVARMETLAASLDKDREESKAVTLFFTTREAPPAVLKRIEELAASAGIVLRIVDTRTESYLTPQNVLEAVPGWSNASFWFCGPTGLGNDFFAELRAKGVNESRLHREMFQFR